VPCHQTLGRLPVSQPHPFDQLERRVDGSIGHMQMLAPRTQLPTSTILPDASGRTACPAGPSRTFLMDEGGAKQRDAPRNRRPGAADDRRDLRAGNRVRFTSRANANEDER